VEDIQQQWQVDRRFAPAMDQSRAEELLKGWQRAVKASIAWAEG